MYVDYYKLQSLPFRLSPDHRFYFDSEPHKEAAACLNDGLAKGRGFIVITGEVGAGKTTLVNRTLSKFRDKDLVTAKIVTPQLEGKELLRMVCTAFGLSPAEGDEPEILRRLESFLIDCRRAERRALLFIDEAQTLPDSALKELPTLSDFQLDGEPLLQIYLVGQPEFRKILSDRTCDPLRQRVVSAYHLRSLDAEETKAYVQHRLQQAGWRDDPKIIGEAFRKIHESTDGIPRRINLLCDRLFLYAYLGELHAIDGDVVMEVVADLRHEGLMKGPDAGSERPGEGQSESALWQLDAKGLAPGLQIPEIEAESDSAAAVLRATNRALKPARREAETGGLAESREAVQKRASKEAPALPELVLVDRVDGDFPPPRVGTDDLAAQRSNALVPPSVTSPREPGPSARTGRALAYGAALLVLVGAAATAWQIRSGGGFGTGGDKLAAASKDAPPATGPSGPSTSASDSGSPTEPGGPPQAEPAAEPVQVQDPATVEPKVAALTPASEMDSAQATQRPAATPEPPAKPAVPAPGAAVWLRPAAEKGVASAQKTLGLMYLGGSGGVSRDYDEALKWLRKAAAQGEAWAQMGLGLMYENSKGVEQDYVEAHIWYSLAASAMSPDDEMRRNVAEGLVRVSAKMTAEQLAEAERLARDRMP